MPSSGKLRLCEEQVCAAQDNTANSAHSRQWGQASKESCGRAGRSAGPDWDREEAAEIGAAAGYEGADEWVEVYKVLKDACAWSTLNSSPYSRAEARRTASEKSLSGQMGVLLCGTQAANPPMVLLSVQQVHCPFQKLRPNNRQIQK